MTALILQILKIIGLVLLAVLGLLILLLLIVLFVPIRYRAAGYRPENEEAAFHASARVTYFFHVVKASFVYPEETYLKLTVFGIQIIPSKREKGVATKRKQQKKSGAETDFSANSGTESEFKENLAAGTISDTKSEPKATSDSKTMEKQTEEAEFENDDTPQKTLKNLLVFLKKLTNPFRNIQYTLQKIYDKIKHIIHHIRFYVRLIQSQSFQNAFTLCKSQLLWILKKILPRKLAADFTIGTGDPANTAQILSIYGICYPLIGEHVTITPDFDHKVIEGNFSLKGHITVFCLIRVAAKVYFDKDLRRVIRLIKKEAAY